MATQAQIDATYNYMDEFWRLSVGPGGDITAALYDGQPGRTLEDAQAAKHAYILRETRIGRESRMLDVGCGWGGLLRAAESAGARSIGLTLSTRQRDACIAGGLDVRLVDWNDATPEALGRFDGIASVGAFEHFCSPEQFKTGQQFDIYRRFFATCHRMLQPHGRLFVQTMLWGHAAPALESVSLAAPKGSPEYLVAALMRFYPGSWLPQGLDQIRDAASPYFALESHCSGRDDYIQTMRAWKARTLRFSWRKAITTARLLPAFFSDRDFVLRLEVLGGDYNKRCFELRVMEHERMVFSRLPAPA